jgi:hypothetical protein
VEDGSADFPHMHTKEAKKSCPGFKSFGCMSTLSGLPSEFQNFHKLSTTSMMKATIFTRKTYYIINYQIYF